MSALAYRSTHVMLATVAVLGGLQFSRSDEYMLVLLVSVASTILSLAALSLPRGAQIRLAGGMATAAIGLLTPLGAVVGMALGFGVSGAAQSPADGARRRDFVGDLLRLALVWALARAYLGVSHEATLLRSGVLVVLGSVFMIVDLALFAAIRGEHDVGSGLTAATGLLKILGPGYLAQVSIGVALVLVYPRLEVFGFLVLVPLMLIMQHTTGLLVKVRASYMHTVGLLAEVAEMQTAGQRGHSRRVSVLATGMGRVLRVGSQQLERLALASLLHDIGRLRVPDPPESGGAHAASAGAVVLSQVSFLASLAPIVQKQAFDYAQFMDLQEQDGRIARIIRLASDVDGLMQDSGETLESFDMAPVLAGSGTLYDPTAVEALQRLRSVAERK